MACHGQKRELMNEEQLKAWVMRQLGYPRVMVELHACHLNDVFEDALDWYIANKGFVRVSTIQVVEGQVLYDPPEDCDIVLDVFREDYAYAIAGIANPPLLYDQGIPYQTGTSPATLGMYSSLAQSIQYDVTARNVLSAEFNWMWDRENRKVILSPKPVRSGMAKIQYKSNCFSIDQLEYFDHLLVREYMLACAKVILGGRIRGKYGTFPAAQGERSIADSDRLYNEGLAEKEKLDLKLRTSCRPMTPIIG